MSKLCKKCGKIKQLEEFHNQKSAKDGKQSNCKICQRKAVTPGNKRRNETYRKYSAYDKAVYALICKSTKAIVYIGESKVAGLRIWEHFNNINGGSYTPLRHLKATERHDKYYPVCLWHGDNDYNRKQQEKELINLHKPKYNA